MIKRTIAIESVNEMEKFRRFVNEGFLSEIEWTLKGKILKIDPEIIDKFEFTGLSNIDFITTGAYKEKIK
jgi:hypothetical protein